MSDYAKALGLHFSPPAKCPRCSRVRTHQVLADAKSSWVEVNSGGDEDHFDGTFFILNCSNCSRTFFLERTVWLEQTQLVHGPDGELEPEEIIHEYVFPPAPPPTMAPSWLASDATLDTALRRLLQEAYRAADAGIFSLAVVGLRAALEQFVRLSGQDPDATNGGLEACIMALMADHKINAAECQTLIAVKSGGDAAIHRNFQPSRTIFETLASPLLELLRPNTGHAKVAAIAHQIPPRPPKQKIPKGPQ